MRHFTSKRLLILTASLLTTATASFAENSPVHLVSERHLQTPSEAGTDSAKSTTPLLRLGEAYQLALEHDHAWAVAQYEYRAAQQAYPIARAALLPNANAGGSIYRVDRDLTNQNNTRSEDQYNQKNAQVQVRQALLNLEASKRVAMSRYDERIASVERVNAHQDLIQRVTNAYLDVLLSQEQVRLVDTQLEATQGQLRQVQSQREAGIATRTDVDEALAQLDRIKADRVAAISSVEISRQQLRHIISQPVSEVVPLSAEVAFSLPSPTEPVAWVDAALEHSPKVVARQFAAEQAALNIERVGGRRYPTVNAAASYSHATATDNGAKRDRIGRIGIELNVPLYSGGGISAEERQAIARNQSAQRQLALARSEAELDASTAHAELTNGLVRIQALEQAVRSGESALQGAKISASVAYRTFVDVLNAEQLLYRSRFDLLDARFEYIRAFVRLQAAVGALDETIVTEINGWLE
ncbi:outer membrane protein [Lampropedia hyalina DSM 16112]|jgi:TolC family type I secretion outer membrane protein|uniref:Outer membrane protein n=1 Tax=Lampropedia hyalina DSM 16112 TaxID=1122156 RepID=A0A1M4WV32_9BURK|nr:TolC family outer membrane protein [Lampropedia hyalina]SHE85151.1 outer membrane protein [Lampropedia hyalina DSM 16112]